MSVAVFDQGGAIGLSFASTGFNNIQATTTRAGTLTAVLSYTLTLPTNKILGASASVTGLSHTGTSTMTLTSTVTDLDPDKPDNVAMVAINQSLPQVAARFAGLIDDCGSDERRMACTPWQLEQFATVTLPARNANPW